MSGRKSFTVADCRGLARFPWRSPDFLLFSPLQMTQQMAGMNFYGANGMMGYGQSMGGGGAQGSNQSLSTQMWK